MHPNWAWALIGVREHGKADVAIVAEDGRCEVLPPGPPWRPFRQRGWDWGHVSQETADLAAMLVSRIWETASPPTWLVGGLCVVLFGLPREGFEIDASELIERLGREVGADRLEEYNLNRWSVVRCRNDG